MLIYIKCHFLKETIPDPYSKTSIFFPSNYLVHYSAYLFI